MLQLTGARLALERDPADAARALAEAERLGRQSLAELRNAVGLLAPGEPQPLSALPTASDIPDLVREVSDAGLVVGLECDGDLASVPPTAGTRDVPHRPGVARQRRAPCRQRARARIDQASTTSTSASRFATQRPHEPRVPSARDGHGLGLVVHARAGASARRHAARRARRRGVASERGHAGRVAGVTIRVLLVDDQELVREGMRRILHESEGFEIVGECDDGGGRRGRGDRATARRRRARHPYAPCRRHRSNPSPPRCTTTRHRSSCSRPSARTRSSRARCARAHRAFSSRMRRARSSSARPARSLRATAGSTRR